MAIKSKQKKLWRFNGVEIQWYTNLRKNKVTIERLPMASFNLDESMESWINSATKREVIEGIKDLIYNNNARRWDLLASIKLLNYQEFLGPVENPYEWKEEDY